MSKISLADLLKTQSMPSINTQVELAKIATPEETQAEAMLGVTDQIRKTDKTPLTALLGGIAEGYAKGQQIKGAKKRSEKLEQINMAIEEQRKAAQEAENLKRYAIAAQGAEQEVERYGPQIAEAFTAFETTGDAGKINQIVRMMPMTGEMIKMWAEAPEQAKINGAAVMQDANGDAMAHFQFVMPDGQSFVSPNGVSLAQLKQFTAKPLADMEAMKNVEKMQGMKDELQVRKLQAEVNKLENPEITVASDGQQVVSSGLTIQEKVRLGLPISAEEKRGFVANQEITKRNEGRQQVSDMLQDLQAKYGNLNEKGGIVNTERGISENLLAKARSSYVGQVVGGAVGTEEQALRQAIENSRPLLINALRQATGMSAKAMDSNRELQFYLQAATDPTQDLQSNLNALRVLDKTYGLNLGIGENLDTSKNPTQQNNNTDPLEGKTATNPQTGERLIRKGGQWIPVQ